MSCAVCGATTGWWLRPNRCCTYCPLSQRSALPWIVVRLCGPPQSGVAAVNKQLLSDILSVLGMVSGEPGRKCLHYKLSGNVKDLASWGHEYVRHLTGEISEVRCR